MHEYEQYRKRKQRRRRDGGYIAVIAILLSVILFLGRLLMEHSTRIHPEGGGYYIAMSAQSGEEIKPDEGVRGDTLGDAEKLDYILSHPEIYPEALRELAQKSDEILDYVYYYPEKKNQILEIDLSGEVERGKIPLLLQWDERWGYLTYGEGLMGYTGCGPTCLSMVAIGLTGNAAITPAAVARYAQENGHYINGSGTAWSLMSQGCEVFGLKARELPLNENTVVRALEAGQPVICSMRAGDFTDGGHFIVLTDCQNGAFAINDPNSRRNSERTWTWAQLEGQIKNLWAYSRRT